jgi:hypothetical protein
MTAKPPSLIKGLIIITTIDHEIPPDLPLTKRGITPLFQRGARGDFVKDGPLYSPLNLRGASPSRATIMTLVSVLGLWRWTDEGGYERGGEWKGREIGR